MTYYSGSSWRIYSIHFLQKVRPLRFVNQTKCIKKAVVSCDVTRGITLGSKLKTPIFAFYLKLVSAIFYQIFIFHQMIALQKLWKMFFISSKKLFLFSRYSNFYIFIFPYFSPVSHCFRGWSKKNLKVYDVINCLNKNLITHFIWYLEKEKSVTLKLCSLIEN